MQLGCAWLIDLAGSLIIDAPSILLEQDKAAVVLLPVVLHETGLQTLEPGKIS